MKDVSIQESYPGISLFFILFLCHFHLISGRGLQFIFQSYLKVFISTVEF